jgi:transposase
MAVEASVRRRWRRWSAAAKARIVAQAEAPGARVAAIAARHAVSAAQIYAWCREARAARGSVAENGFVPVVVEDAPAPIGRGEIEIVLADVRVMVRGAVDAPALRNVLAVLRG